MGVGPKFYIVLVALTILCSSTMAQEAAEDWMATGQDLMMNGSEEEALTAYERAVDLDPQNAEAWGYKAILLRDQGNYDAAISAFDRTIELDPQNIAAKVEKAGTLITMHYYGKAD